MSTLSPSRGRPFLWLGLVLCLVGFPLAMVLVNLNVLIIPWYVPALSTLGALLILVSFVKRRTVVRGVLLVLTIAFAALEWHFIAVDLKLPDYAGPAKVGSPLPSFQTALADGSTFTDKDFATGQTTVLTFFRGRW